MVVPCLYRVVPCVVPWLYHGCTVLVPCLYRVVPCLFRVERCLYRVCSLTYQLVTVTVSVRLPNSLHAPLRRWHEESALELTRLGSVACWPPLCWRMLHPCCRLTALTAGRPLVGGRSPCARAALAALRCADDDGRQRRCSRIEMVGCPMARGSACGYRCMRNATRSPSRHGVCNVQIILQPAKCNMEHETQ